MRLRTVSLGLLASALLAGLVLGLAASASAGHKPGKGKGRTKVTLCHKRMVTITVGEPAVRAHLRHGDTLGPCRAALTVVKHVINDNGGTKTASDFTLTINGVTAEGGNSFPGSETGVTKTITSFGHYNVSETLPAGYAQTSASAGCAGTILAGDQKTCVITNDDIPATLTVIKSVVNDEGGAKTAGDFTLTINGVSAAGGNTFAGSATGVTKTLTSVGAYNVTEIPMSGYTLKSASPDCSGTIALGQHKSCTLINDDLP